MTIHEFSRINSYKIIIQCLKEIEYPNVINRLSNEIDRTQFNKLVLHEISMAKIFYP